MSGDRTSRRDIDEALDTLTLPGDDETNYRDELGPAVYRLNPGRTVVACLVCRHMALMPTIPRVPELTWTCTGCGKPWALRPPAIVWIEGSRPALVGPQ